ncbi:hypothetical protein [Streptomyces sp. VNUA24]|uniref:hypothetical protein n=1 Tax=Streptomyces sp. VNUA24 TaxID=3031131 RepID=UPI0023B7DDDC|nr:hypothetical protein [Streptomyces sp. VNUA24]WEH19728.1 hypothetical protein PYR72_41070 [Streptomyces sp. VNUA24]
MSHRSAQLPARAAVPEAASDAPAPVGRRFITLYVIAHLGLYPAVMSPLLVSLAIRLEDVDPDGRTRSLGLVVGVGTLVSIVAGVVIGVLGDNTTARLGRRKPWIIAGIPALLAGTVVTGVAASRALWPWPPVGTRTSCADSVKPSTARPGTWVWTSCSVPA